MSDTVISLAGVTKSFRRFHHPGWRAVSALGMPVASKHYDVFTALDDIGFEIKRGEKVALIGRNGAGKSTLLRIISGQMRPDKGSIIVNGSVQALMELGTGFHSDFTGVENIRSALSLQGMSAKRMNACIDEIIDFTELESFIDRPVREYSAGMYARLAFAVATSVNPEVLIVDEILGAGDAYFVGKSIQRMRRLTDNGATVLFVSHDMSSVQMLCDRAIWIEHGRLRKDDGILAVSKSYLTSVREDEEKRLRSKTMSLTREQVASFIGPDDNTLFRLVTQDSEGPSDPFKLHSVRFGYDDVQLGELAPGKHVIPNGKIIIDPEFMNWGKEDNTSSTAFLPFGQYGGRYGHAPWQVRWPMGSGSNKWIVIDYTASLTDEVRLEYYSEKKSSYDILGSIPANGNSGSLTVELDLNFASSEVDSDSSLVSLAKEDRYGTGEVKINGFAFFDAQHTRRHTLISGAPAYAVMSYECEGEVFDPVAVVAIYRPDGTCATQLISTISGASFGKLPASGRIRVDCEPLYLGPGDYIISVALFRELNLTSNIEPAALDLHDRCYALKVLPPEGVGVTLGIVNQPAQWDIF